MDSWLSLLFDQPTVYSGMGLFFSIILLSYLLEDLAIITAALLAADGLLSAPLALLAIFIGIATGDMGLYALGLLAQKWRGLRYRLYSHPSMRKVRQRLKKRTFWNIVIIRFIPGLRFIGFTLSGLYKVNFPQFMAAVLAATGAWTGLVFLCIYQLGRTEWFSDSHWKWLIAPCALVILWWINRTNGKEHSRHYFVR